MKRSTIHNRRTRRKANKSSYPEKKKRQYRGIFNVESPFFLTDGSIGIPLSEFKRRTQKTPNSRV